jgi:hypothetical protein
MVMRPCAARAARSTASTMVPIVVPTSPALLFDDLGDRPVEQQGEQEKSASRVALHDALIGVDEPCTSSLATAPSG